MGGREEEVRLVRSIFTDWQVQTERQSENSSRGKQGNLFQKTLQGVSAKSHTILSAVSVCAAVVLHCRTKYLKMSGSIFLRQIKYTATVQNCSYKSQKFITTCKFTWTPPPPPLKMLNYYKTNGRSSACKQQKLRVQYEALLWTLMPLYYRLTNAENYYRAGQKKKLFRLWGNKV